MFQLKKLAFILKFLSILSLAFSVSACEKAHTFSEKIKHFLFHSEEAHLKNSPGSPSQDAKTASAQAQNPQTIAMVENVKIIRDVAYGTHPKQRMDIYAPAHAKHAPVIVFLHGGGWTSGEKDAPIIYIHKVNRWVPKGLIVISVETRLMPEANVYAQVQDFAQAVASAQQHATDWGGDADQFILMGHSSGGTIASVLSADPKRVTDLGGKRWLATFSLDSSSLDIERTMRLWKPDMFTYAYGNDAKKWPSASPFALLNQDSIPIFIACSMFRPDSSCEQAQLFKEKADTFSIKIEISPQKLNHGEVNDMLGTDSAYTESAEAFMATLDSSVANLLKSKVSH